MKLSDAELFAACTPETLLELEAVVKRRALAAGEVLFDEGAPGTFMFLLVSGRLAVDKRGDG
ncbi:MAG: cyclic nucleotide-binding domain-containing protein, partial [Myxococcota bacterium]